MNRNHGILLILLLLILSQAGGMVSTGVDRVTYVYEKDEGAVPPAIAKMLMDMNADGAIMATEWERDSIVPKQYEPASKAVPSGRALVAQSGADVVKVLPVTKSTTYEEAMEVVK